jgi:hypothetical protein
MSTFKHTPGPWGAHNNEVFAGPFKRIKGGISGFRAHICEMDDLDLDEDEVEANARLIAAAPDLLEALRPFAELDMRPDGFDKRDDSQPIYARDNSVITVGDVRRAVAAIAKATQEPQE